MQKALGSGERGKAEAWMGAGFPYPTRRQCEMGNSNTQPPLTSLSASAAGRKGGLKKPLAKMVLPQRAGAVPCLLCFPPCFPLASLLSVSSIISALEAPAPAG